MKNQNILITLLLVVIFSGVGFFGGTIYQKSKTPTFGGRFTNTNRADNNPQNIRGRMGGGQVQGDIISADDKSITVKLPDGSSKIILVSSTTSINKASEGTITDLKVSEKVAAFGTTNQDGSVTAQNIQLNPIMRGRPENLTITPAK
jgi:hypothetical protein